MSNAITIVLSIAGMAAAAVVSAAAVRGLARWADRRGLRDLPNHRSSHVRPIPRIGGVVIVVATTLAAVLAGIMFPAASTAIAAALLPGLAVAGVSLADDLRGVSIGLRFGVHAAAAAAVTAWLGPLPAVELGSFGSLELGRLAWPLTLLWIVGLTNAFNFMDGIDGIAGVTAVIAASALAVAGLVCGAPAVAVVAAALAAAATGFLGSNWQPAAIFMGDVGSTFIGFLLAVLPLAAGRPLAAALIAVVAAAAWPFIFDTAFTLVRRLARRENVLEAHRTHLYQRLVAAGLSHATVASLYGGLSLAGGILAVISTTLPGSRPAVDGLAASFAVAAAVGLVAAVRARECRDPMTSRVARGLRGLRGTS